jgi:GNAT superfamily N-acetyltransferase
MARLRPNLRISQLELQSPDELESIADINLRTLRALGLVAQIDGGLTSSRIGDKSLDFDRVCERLDEIRDEGELLVAQDMEGGRIVGALQASFNERLDEYMIDYLVVEATYRRRGVGRELMSTANRRACDYSLGNLSLNSLDQSIEFYDKIGFVINPADGGLSGYYTPMTMPVSAHTMLA